MNSVFWLVASAMVLIALLIILPPLWRKPDNKAADDLDQRNIKIARDRLAELQANKESGGLSQAQYDEQVAELELALSDDLELINPTINTHSQGCWLVYVLVAAIPFLSASLYWKLGDYQAIGRVDEPTQASQTDSAMPSPEVINKMVAGLAEKLKAKPDNLEGWVMLGRSYKMLERYPESSDAFAHAYQLAGDKADVMLSYAEVLALSKNGDWAGTPKELVMKVLTKEPENLTGLWFAAMANAQQGDKKSAVGFLRKLEALLPADAPDKQQIRDIIANTEGQPSPVQGKVEQSTETSDISLTVQVSLANELQSSVKPEDTVFIYAQAITGPKMPLAIIRKQARELPLSVNLTDADSMLPNMKLSSFKQVRLLARISKFGNAMPQPGDLIGLIEQADLADRNPYKIVINDRVK
ncbi:c-type cytochrome biogenesis protein CcmI [Methyloglobulus sp.]|uniref:c-type cytochrome biogenesis protein CcmI n=1 Tax=Methyloglobulus sp. TaxID=2518622 RepID=UPI0032B7BFC9